MDKQPTVIRGDITTARTEAIVNAANKYLRPGGGVDGAIHRAAGPGLRELLARIAEVEPGVRCPTGQAVITGACDLPVDFIIHAVGPVYDPDDHDQCCELLAGCYRAALGLAAENGIGSIAFPFISAGVYGFPREPAAAIAVGEMRAWKRAHALPGEICIYCFSAEDEAVFLRIV